MFESLRDCGDAQITCADMRSPPGSASIRPRAHMYILMHFDGFSPSLSNIARMCPNDISLEVKGER